MNKVIGCIVISLMAVPAMAALSPQHVEWGAGPAQWIMTSDEKRAWRKVTTDSDAVNFIDLFWVRRDPTTGTAVNEYRNDFEGRVAFADQAYGEKRKRGAMTDRGRVYIVLGAATNMNAELRSTNAQKNVSIASDSDFAAGSVQGARDVWRWEYEDARKFGMSKIEVIFIEDPITRRFQCDPTRADFGMAGPAAIKRAVVNPDLTAVPAWAPTGGLRPVAPLTIAAVPAVPSIPPVSDEPVEPSDVPADVAVESAVESNEPPVASSTSGISRLTLLRGKWIDSRSPTDPFAGHVETSVKSGDLRWAAQFCSATAEVPKLKFNLLIVGPLDGASKQQVTKETDARPERMSSKPGCYVLQGSVPKLAAGQYKLAVLLEEPATGELYDVRGEFRIE